MAIFPENEYGAVDYAILRDGGISLYRRTDYLGEDSERLGEVGYQLIQVDCETWRTEIHMHESLSRALSFPSYYGHNLNALNDVITDADISQTGGLALILLQYDRFSKLDFTLAGTVLDIFSRASHNYLLTGRRFVTLVQSDDPDLSFPKVGGSAPGWNRREWLNKDRGL